MRVSAVTRAYPGETFTGRVSFVFPHVDLDTRTILQVKVGELDEADEIFSRLMGDVVEPRREFIQANALQVANLDV